MPAGPNEKSIQRGTVTIAGTATSNTATITAVSFTTNCSVKNLGWNTDVNTSLNNLPGAFGSVALTNTTTVTATRQQPSGSTQLVVGFEIVEYRAVGP